MDWLSIYWKRSGLHLLVSGMYNFFWSFVYFFPCVFVLLILPFTTKFKLMISNHLPVAGGSMQAFWLNVIKMELFILLEHLTSSPGFSDVCVTRSLVLCAMFCRSLFVLFSSPGSKVQVNYCHQLASVVCKLFTFQVLQVVKCKNDRQFWSPEIWISVYDQEYSIQVHHSMRTHLQLLIWRVLNLRLFL